MVKITDVRAILTQPDACRLVVVRVDTSEPGLFGIGCATFTQRAFAVQAAVERHLAPFLVGRDVDRIEEIWQMSMNHGYWRNGPVLNNAVSGVDQALWDIKGKQAGMPVYQLLGGRTREAAATYVHADGRDAHEVADNAVALIEQGFAHVRVQMGGYGGPADGLRLPPTAPPGNYFDPRGYGRAMLGMIDHVRSTVGDDIELLHDIHERLHPIDAVQFAKDLEQYRLFFLEDPFAPEDTGWFSTLRQQCATPLAMGELFNNPHEWQPLITGRLIDFVRMHVSQIGGITPARAVSELAATFGVRTAWHGPADTSPVGHAANLHLDMWAPNFGIQEWPQPSELTYEMFPGLPRPVDGYLHPGDGPGLGIDIDEKLAAEHPCDETVEQWTQTRLPDGGPARP
ncbi:MAG: bifunctional D-altronate/D-mannonate dehydratase [Acidimicrobiaceae bacterium]|nr:bifunctional D-altronate/D-mannonate dehydratase [Acidimicrobiaceae bacterium]